MLILLNSFLSSSVNVESFICEQTSWNIHPVLEATCPIALRWRILALFNCARDILNTTVRLPILDKFSLENVLMTWRKASAGFEMSHN